jgi:hypothetical protein
MISALWTGLWMKYSDSLAALELRVRDDRRIDEGTNSQDLRASA